MATEPQGVAPGEDFFTVLAASRASLAGQVPTGFEQTLDRLRGLARNARERILMGALEVHFEAKTGTAGYRQRGFDRLRAASGDELLEAVRATPDLTMLGDWTDRMGLL